MRNLFTFIGIFTVAVIVNLLLMMAIWDVFGERVADGIQMPCSIATSCLEIWIYLKVLRGSGHG